VHVGALEGAALTVGQRNLPAGNYQEFLDCVLVAGPNAPKVLVTDGNNPWLAHFVRSGIRPEDIVFETLAGGNEGSHILIDHEDGRRWEIAVENGERIVRQR
jgi:hypothetical protein